jgi:hypothetical protein
MKNDKILVTAGLTVILLDFLLIASIIHLHVQLDPTAATLIGGFNTLAGTVVGYYWGSSKGSSETSQTPVTEPLPSPDTPQGNTPASQTDPNAAKTEA